MRTSNRKAHPTSFARRFGAIGGLCGALLLTGLTGLAAPARADDGLPLLAPLSAAKPQQAKGGTPLVGSVPTTATTAVASAPGANRNDPLCRTKLKLVAQLEREKARALTLLARATDRLERARDTSRPAVVAAFQKEVDSNEARVEELQDKLDELRLRCA